jgi:uncharacterized protein (DUF433 family)
MPSDARFRSIQEAFDAPRYRVLVSLCFDIGEHLGRGRDSGPDATLNTSTCSSIASTRPTYENLLHRHDPLPHRTPESYPCDMLDWTQCAAVERDPARVSGAWVFRGTRVPVKALFENVEDGARVDDVLAWFPGVTRQQVEAVLQHAELSLALA